jgi:hypothetical protein
MLAPADGSIDLAWVQRAKPWQLRMAAAMLAPYNPVTAAVLFARANNLDPERREWLPTRTPAKEM